MDDKTFMTKIHRIEGQVRGIERMWQDKREIVQIIQQLDAVRSSLNRVIVQLLTEDLLESNQIKQLIPYSKLNYLKKYLEKQI